VAEGLDVVEVWVDLILLFHTAVTLVYLDVSILGEDLCCVPVFVFFFARRGGYSSLDSRGEMESLTK
jgi:hypothetical protein